MESQPQNPEFRNNPENFHPFPLDKSGLPVYGIRLRSLNNSADCFGNPIFRTNALQT